VVGTNLGPRAMAGFVTSNGEPSNPATSVTWLLYKISYRPGY
jgi:hypothetical protein